MRERRGLAAVACGVVALGALTGCSATGELWVGEDDVRIDIELRYPSTDNVWFCERDNLPPDVTVEPLEAPSAEEACRITGTVALREPTGQSSWIGFVVGESNGFVTMVLPAFGLGFGSSGGIDLTAHLPGEVLAVGGGGVVEGTSVRWTDVDAVRAQGMAFTARTRPALPSWVVPAAAGLLVGGLVVPALAWLRRRPAARPSPASEGHHEGEPTMRAAEPGAGRPTFDHRPAAPQPTEPEDPEVWSRP